MPTDEAATTEGVETAEGQVETNADTQDDGVPPEGSADAEGQVEADLPEWARERLTKANGEAARYRKQLRETQELLDKASTPEQMAEVRDGLNDTIRNLERELVAARHNLPGDLAAVLQGGTREEMEAHAKVLQRYAPKGGVKEVLGGLTPGDEGKLAGMDPGALARKWRGRR